MIRFTYSILLSLFCIAIYGCATIINGSTQDVHVIMPEGTKITNRSGFDGEPIVIQNSNGYAILRLKRKNDYPLLFQYKNQQASIFLTSTFEPGWIVADFFTDFIGYIVDGITGDWNSFQYPITINFPTDTSTHENYSKSIVELNNNDSQIPKIGIILNPKFGLIFSGDVGFLYGLGVGYEFTPRLSLTLAYEGGLNTQILPRYSNYYGTEYYSQINLECRFKASGNLYMTAGGGMSNITSDSLTLDRYSYSEITHRNYEDPISTAPLNKWIPSLFIGIVVSGQSSYIELRHTFGLSKLPLSSGEVGNFETTSLNFGLNLKF